MAKDDRFLIANQFTGTGDIILIFDQSQAGYEYLNYIAIAIMKVFTLLKLV